MNFKYRLARVLELREDQLEDAQRVFQNAQYHLQEIKKQIQDNHNQQKEIKYILTQAEGIHNNKLYTNRLKKLESLQETLLYQKEVAEEQLEQAKQAMLMAQQKLEALNKHREKEKQNYMQAENEKEQKELNELALIMKRLNDEKEQYFEENS